MIVVELAPETCFDRLPLGREKSRASTKSTRTIEIRTKAAWKASSV